MGATSPSPNDGRKINKRGECFGNQFGDRGQVNRYTRCCLNQSIAEAVAAAAAQRMGVRREAAVRDGVTEGKEN